MPDKRSNATNDLDMTDHQSEESALHNAPSAPHDFDQMQEQFDALESNTLDGKALAAQFRPSQCNTSTATDTSTQTNENPAEPNAETENNEQSSDAFNDLVNAFAVENIPTPTTDTNNDSDASDKAISDNLLDPVSEAALPESDPASDANDFDLSHLHEDTSSPATASNTTPAPILDEAILNFDKPTPIVDEPALVSDAIKINEMNINEVEPELSSNALFENEAPVYANLSREHHDEQRPTGQIIAFAGALLLTLAGGIYWFTAETPEQPASTMQDTVMQASSHDLATNTATPTAELTPPATQANNTPPSSSARSSSETKQTDTQQAAVPPTQSSPMETATKAQQQSGNSEAIKPSAQHSIAPKAVHPKQAITVQPLSPIDTPTDTPADISPAHQEVLNDPSSSLIQTTIPATHQIVKSDAKTQNIKQHEPAKAMPQAATTQTLIVHPLSSTATSTNIPSSQQNLHKDSAPVQPSAHIADVHQIVNKNVAQLEQSKAAKASRPSTSAQSIIIEPLTLSHASVAQKKNPPQATKHAPQVIAIQSPSTPQPATMQTARPQQHAPKAAPQAQNTWALLASVPSNKIARQQMARFKAQHLDSKVIQMKGNGKIHHFIQITGFKNQQAAQKQRDVLRNIPGFTDIQVNQL